MIIISNIKNVLKSLYKLIALIDSRSWGVISGMTLILWAVIFITQPIYNVKNYYVFFEKVFNRHTWGILFLMIGSIQMVSSLQTKLKSVICHSIISFSTSIIWLYISICVLLATPITTAAAIYPILAIVSMVDFIKIKFN